MTTTAPFGARAHPAKTVSATVRAIGETLTFVVDGLRVESDWEGGALLEVRVPSQGLVVRRLQY